MKGKASAPFHPHQTYSAILLQSVSLIFALASPLGSASATMCSWCMNPCWLHAAIHCRQHSWPRHLKGKCRPPCTALAQCPTGRLYNSTMLLTSCFLSQAVEPGQDALPCGSPGAHALIILFMCVMLRPCIILIFTITCSHSCQRVQLLSSSLPCSLSHLWRQACQACF